MREIYGSNLIKMNEKAVKMNFFKGMHREINVTERYSLISGILYIFAF